MERIVASYDFLGKSNKLSSTTYNHSQFGAFLAAGNVKNMSKINREAMYYYKEILYGISDLASQLGLTTNAEIAYLFQFLLKNGYLSINHFYQERLQTIPTLPIGMAIMGGTASEFNQTAMLENLFETCNREAYLIAVSHLESYFKAYSTQIIFPVNSLYYTFDSGRGLYGTSDKKIGSRTPDGTRLKFSPYMTQKIASNNVHMNLVREVAPTKGAEIRSSLRFSSGKLKPFAEHESLVYLHNYLEQNRGFIEQFYRSQYYNISKVAEFVPSVR